MTAHDVSSNGLLRVPLSTVHPVHIIDVFGVFRRYAGMMFAAWLISRDTSLVAVTL